MTGRIERGIARDCVISLVAHRSSSRFGGYLTCKVKGSTIFMYLPSRLWRGLPDEIREGPINETTRWLLGRKCDVLITHYVDEDIHHWVGMLIRIEGVVSQFPEPYRFTGHTRGKAPIAGAA